MKTICSARIMWNERVNPKLLLVHSLESHCKNVEILGQKIWEGMKKLPHMFGLLQYIEKELTPEDIRKAFYYHDLGKQDCDIIIEEKDSEIVDHYKGQCEKGVEKLSKEKFSSDFAKRFAQELVKYHHSFDTKDIVRAINRLLLRRKEDLSGSLIGRVFTLALYSLRQADNLDAACIKAMTKAKFNPLSLARPDCDFFILKLEEKHERYFTLDIRSKLVNPSELTLKYDVFQIEFSEFLRIGSMKEGKVFLLRRNLHEILRVAQSESLTAALRFERT
ncbi:MAG: HD domain-containing protein [Nitrososphaerales archaeon]